VSTRTQKATSRDAALGPRLRVRANHSVQHRPARSPETPRDYPRQQTRAFALLPRI
jgi:hypothetical protein